MNKYSTDKFSLYQACNDRVGYFFTSYDAAKSLADDLPEGLVKGLTDNHDWIEIEEQQELSA